MTTIKATRVVVLSLYKQLLREGAKFPAYNFREYTKRRVRDAFKDNKAMEDFEQIKQCIGTAQVQLDSLRRQIIIGSLYQTDKLIIEKESLSL